MSKRKPLTARQERRAEQEWLLGPRALEPLRDRKAEKRKERDKRLCLLDTAVVAPMAGVALRPGMADVWAQRSNARRFLFDLAASVRVGEMMREHLDMLIDNIEFARTPFPTSYFEIDLRSLWAAWRPEQYYAPDADERVGFLVHNGTAIVLTTGKRPDSMRDPRWVNDLIAGLAFRINRPQSIPFEKLTGHPDSEQADLIKASYVFGGQRLFKSSDGTYEKRDGNHTHILATGAGRGTTGHRVHLPRLHGAWTVEQIAAHFDVVPSLTPIDTNDFTELCFMAGGDPLILITMLLLINQPSKYVALNPVAREVGLWRGARKVFREHHVVTLHISDRPVRVRDIFNLTDRKAPVAHGVKGHWKSFNKSVGCDHHHPDQRQAWEPVGADRTLEGDYKRYWCPLCLQRRTWTEHYDTGGPGVATTEYTVTR